MSQPNIIHLDYETYSACDLKECGGHRYARDPSTEILMIGLALNDEEPVVWQPSNGVCKGNDLGLAKILKFLSEPSTLVYAHNATGFEIPITDVLFERTTGFKPPAHHQWRCTAAMARTAAMPVALDKLAVALGMAEQKDARGKALIRKFSIPQEATARQIKAGTQVAPRIFPHDDPAAFAEFVEYCRQDVVVERAIGHKLHHFELRGISLQGFQFDIEMNCRGFPVNLDGINRVRGIIDEVTAKVMSEFRCITGFLPTQGALFLKWLTERGYKGANLTADSIEEELPENEMAELMSDITPEAIQALRLKQLISYAATKKIEAMAKVAGPDDNRVRGCLTYHGATTGRWTAQKVQPQNFKRPTIDDSEDAYRAICAGLDPIGIQVMYGPPLEAISSCVRHFIHDIEKYEHERGFSFNEREMLDADYSGIEPRVILWLAGQEDGLDEFRNKLDPYITMAAAVFGKSYDEIKRGYEAEELKYVEMRAVGKEAVLGCGFQMGARKFQGRVLERTGIRLTRKESIAVVRAFRIKNHKIADYKTGLWKQLEESAMAAIRSPGTKFNAGPLLKFFVARTMGMQCLFLELPSGRRLCYPRPAIEPKTRLITDPLTDEPVIDPETGKQMRKTSEGITFWGQLPKSVHYGRLHVFGGLLAENAVQATAADVMTNGAVNCERKGYEIAALIHDEALSYYYPERGQTIQEFNSLLEALPVWGDGLPIVAKGKVVPFYKK